MTNFEVHLTKEQNDDLKEYIQKLRRQLSQLSADYHELAEVLEAAIMKAKKFKDQRDTAYYVIDQHRKRGIYIDDEFKADDLNPVIYHIPRTGGIFYIFSRKSYNRLKIKHDTGQIKKIEGIQDILTTKEKELKKLHRAKSTDKDNFKKIKKLYSTALTTIKHNEATIKDLKAKVQKKDNETATTADGSEDEADDTDHGPTADNTDTTADSSARDTADNTETTAGITADDKKYYMTLKY